MKILIDIGHPAHVHLFGCFAQQMKTRGHSVLFTCREKEFEIALLEAYGLNYVSFGKKFKSIPGKLFGLLKFDLLEIINGIKFKPDLFMSHGSPYAAHAAFMLRKPHVSFEDTGNMEQVKLYMPFTKHVLTSDSFKKDLGPKQLRYAGYHELAYLHPNQFKPDNSIYKLLELKEGEPYSLLRFVAWNASHDLGHFGLSTENKRQVVQHLLQRTKVFISAEGELPSDLDRYRIQIPPEKIHHALAFASLYFGESCTMASEAAMLATPTFLISGFPKDAFGTLVEQEAYGLLKMYSTFEESLIQEIDKSLSADRNALLDQRNTMLNTKLDVTAFMIWFAENYPASSTLLRNKKIEGLF